ncbi:CarD family transcriptional regulator [Alkalicoccus chagannorensis]|uniref:CarD family transcriptional regulator n=1 Tax=Alkalicoccus chagannorensis TaxID=427072 RepID=UPI000425055D|nr:CarD family transcriptional regulator [Alkalicoccus chagannorensis]
MFEAGDSVFYPGHGAGTITEIIKKSFIEEEELYLVVYFPMQEMTLMLPEQTIHDSSLRPVTEPGTLSVLLEKLHTREVPESYEKPSRRRDTRLDTGSVETCMNLYHELHCKNCSEHRLHVEEKKTFESARKLLLSEIMLSYQISKEEAEKELQQSLSGV